MSLLAQNAMKLPIYMIIYASVSASKYLNVKDINGTIYVQNAKKDTFYIKINALHQKLKIVNLI